MHRSPSRVARPLAIVALACAALAPCAAPSSAQVTATTARTRWYGIDSLRFGAVGALVGTVKPINIEPATSWTIAADYGELRPGWRVTFSASHWGSRFTDRAVAAYADSLRGTIDDPTGDATVNLDDIDVTVISVAGDLRRVWSPAPWFRPSLGGGLASHVINADGPLIDGTFVERAVDNLVLGFAATAGVDLVLLHHLAIEAQARYDLFSLARFGSLRVGASWYFDRVSRPRTP